MTRFAAAHSCFATIRSVLGLLAVLVTVACGDETGPYGKEAYFPLTEGWRWQYDVVLDTKSTGRTHQKYFVLNFPRHKVGERETTPRLFHDGTVYFVAESQTGVERLAARKPGGGMRRQEPPRIILKYPVTPGTTWSQEEDTLLLNTRTLFNAPMATAIPIRMEYVIETAEDVVRVPAGVFRHCVKVAGKGGTSVVDRFSDATIFISVETAQWFVPGTGLVKSQRTESSSNQRIEPGNFTQVLSALSRG